MLTGTGTAELAYRETRQHDSLLAAISRAIASHRNLNELFDGLAESLHNIVSFEYLSVVLHDTARDVMRMHVLKSAVPSPLREGMEFRMDESLAAFVMRAAKPMIIADTEQDTGFEKLTKILASHNVKSICSLPLITARRNLGAVSFGSSVKNAFVEEDFEVLQLVADQVAVSVENALNFEAAQRLRDRLARERDRLKLLLDVNNAVVSNLNLHAFFEAVPTSVRRAMQCDAVSIALPEPNGTEFRLHGLDIRDGHGFFRDQMTIPVSGSYSGTAYGSGKPFTFGIVPENPSPFMRQAHDLEQMNSGCFLPIVRGERKLGVLVLLDRREHAFCPPDVEFLVQIANQVAIAMENALNYQEVQESKERLAKERLYLLNEIRSEHRFDELVGSSPALKGVLGHIETVAPTDSTVLIEGETGTGKEVIARTVHNLSYRREHSFIKVNCAAIPSGLLESELFGHERGAFTGALAQKIGRFELAHKGTLFLDEIGDMPLELQPKLLRVLQEQEFERLGGTRSIKVDVRIVAATNHDLGKMVEERQFRADLYYRLKVFPVGMPPLRQRKTDIPQLVRYFATKYAERMNKPIATIPTSAMDAMVEYDWPGNIRELQNFIERAVILSSDTVLRPPLAELKKSVEPGLTLTENGNSLHNAEREHILRMLRETGWVLGGTAGAAAKLGIPRTTLLYKMGRLGIPREEA